MEIQLRIKIMSRTCHCCEASEGSCAGDYCSPWAMTLRGPSIIRSLAEGPIEKYYKFGCEFNQDSFIWSLKPELTCEDPIYLQKGKGNPSWFWQYVKERKILWENGYDSQSFFLTMTKIFYINSNTNVTITIKGEQNKVPVSSYIGAAPLNAYLCNAYRTCCGFASNGVCFNTPLSNLSDYWSGNQCPDSLFSRGDTKFKFPRFSIVDGFQTANSLTTENINCDNRFYSDNRLNFNTGGNGGYFYIKIRIAAEDSIRPTRLPNNGSWDLIHGYENFGAVKITGINPYICSRFSKMMMTNDDEAPYATNPKIPPYLGNSCFSEPFSIKSYIDPDLLRKRHYEAIMKWGFDTTIDNGYIIIDPKTGKQILDEELFYGDYRFNVPDMFYQGDCDMHGIAPLRD